jgi:hypothetical protein
VEGQVVLYVLERTGKTFSFTVCNTGDGLDYHQATYAGEKPAIGAVIFQPLYTHPTS